MFLPKRELFNFLSLLFFTFYIFIIEKKYFRRTKTSRLLISLLALLPSRVFTDFIRIQIRCRCLALRPSSPMCFCQTVQFSLLCSPNLPNRRKKPLSSETKQDVLHPLSRTLNMNVSWSSTSVFSSFLPTRTTRALASASWCGGR